MPISVIRWTANRPQYLMFSSPRSTLIAIRSHALRPDFKSLILVGPRRPRMYNTSPHTLILLVTPLPTLRRPNLIHFRNSLLEFHILAFLIRMSLVLSIYASANTCSSPPSPPPSTSLALAPHALNSPGPRLRYDHPSMCSRKLERARRSAYLASPRQIVLPKTALVQRDEEVGAAIAVLEGETSGGHGFAGGRGI